MAAKQTKGRQKIEMKRIEKPEDRLITFSKRRSGIYKKASELVTLTGAEVGFMVFSPSGKPFSYAHPSIEAVTNRILRPDRPPNDFSYPYMEAERQRRIDEANHKHNEALKKLETEKERLKSTTERNEPLGWWERRIDMMNMQQLQDLYQSFDDLHQSLLNKIEDKTQEASSSSMLNVPPMNPGQAAANPFPPNGGDTDLPGALPFRYGYNYKPGQF